MGNLGSGKGNGRKQDACGSKNLDSGSWNSSKKVGYKVIRVVFDDQGNPISTNDFLTGFLDDQKVLGRPAAPFMLSDGSLLISDDYSGAIFRVKATP